MWNILPSLIELVKFFSWHFDLVVTVTPYVKRSFLSGVFLVDVFGYS